MLQIPDIKRVTKLTSNDMKPYGHYHVNILGIGLRRLSLTRFPFSIGQKHCVLYVARL